jgi:adenylate kinase family enzyme
MSGGARVTRIVVAGLPGAGKSTLARAISASIGLPYVEADAYLHGPRWTRNRFFERDLAAALPANGRWVTDAGGPLGRELLWQRADTLVWLDLPRRVVMARVLRRSIRRALFATKLWAGNQERFSDWLRPSHPIRLSWSLHQARRQEYARLLGDPNYRHLQVIHITSIHEGRSWLVSLRGAARPGEAEPYRRFQ